MIAVDENEIPHGRLCQKLGKRRPSWVELKEPRGRALGVLLEQQGFLPLVDRERAEVVGPDTAVRLPQTAQHLHRKHERAAPAAPDLQVRRHEWPGGEESDVRAKLPGVLVNAEPAGVPQHLCRQFPRVLVVDAARQHQRLDGGRVAESRDRRRTEASPRRVQRHRGPNVVAERREARGERINISEVADARAVDGKSLIERGPGRVVDGAESRAKRIHQGAAVQILDREPRDGEIVARLPVLKVREPPVRVPSERDRPGRRAVGRDGIARHRHDECPSPEPRHRRLYKGMMRDFDVDGEEGSHLLAEASRRRRHDDGLRRRRRFRKVALLRDAPPHVVHELVHDAPGAVGRELAAPAELQARPHAESVRDRTQRLGTPIHGERDLVRHAVDGRDERERGVRAAARREQRLF